MNAPVAATEDLIYSVEDGIARLTFNRPQARNALTFAMLRQASMIDWRFSRSFVVGIPGPLATHGQCLIIASQYSRTLLLRVEWEKS